MGQIDSTALDTVVYGLSNIGHYNGWNIAFSGILVVFGGLVLIALTIFAFNKLSALVETFRTKSETPKQPAKTNISLTDKEEKIPEEHLVAISVAVELYRRLHLETLQSTVTFARGELNSNWKAGTRFGLRKS